MLIQNASDIDRLIVLDQQDQIKRGATFFEIIGRSYDEDLVSRMLSYTLQKDAELVNKLLKRVFCYEVRVTKKSCICEKAVPSGRIDIFVEAEDETGCKYTLTIENKVNSWEHDDQTKKYYDFVNTNYPKRKNAFYYLKPFYNQSNCSCDKFVQITYKNLYQMIETCNDNIIVDFKKHIKEYFCEKELKMNEAEKAVLKHYSEMKDLMYRAETVYNLEKNKIFEILKQEFISDKDTWGSQMEGGSCRLYRKKWWSGEKENDYEKYYFYVELYFVNNTPEEIVVQGTIKRYGQSIKSSMVYQFHKNDWVDNRYCVHFKQSFTSENELFSKEWLQDLEDFSKKYMPKAIEESDKLFAEFEDYKAKIV